MEYDNGGSLIKVGHLIYTGLVQCTITSDFALWFVVLRENNL